MAFKLRCFLFARLPVGGRVRVGRSINTKALSFGKNFGKILTILAIFCASTTSMTDPYKKRYAPFKVIKQSQLLKPSVPFPGLFEFATPKAPFFAKVKTSKDGPVVLKPQLSHEFGKKRFVHYNDDVFVPNEGIDFLALRRNFDFKEMTSEMLANVLEEQMENLTKDLDFPLDNLGDLGLGSSDSGANANMKSKGSKKKHHSTKIPAYYQNLFSEYDPNIQFYDPYSRDDYYIDMLKFLNKMKTSVDHYALPTTDPNSQYFHGIGQLIVRKLNSYRRSQKLKDNVVWSEPMYFYVMEHSIHMSQIHKLTHDGFDTRSAYVRRMYHLKASSENLASFQSFSLMSKEEIAERFMQLWIKSEGHRLNMEKDFNMCSVAVFKTANQEYYGTMFLIKI